jgi:uncharacterized protein YndB with AHSA1/START domain
MAKTQALLAFIAAAWLVPVAAAPERMIEKQAVVGAPIGEVWKAWTTTEGVKSFFAPDAKIEARSGGPFEIYMNPYAPAGLKGADDMRFLAVQEPTMFSFTWNAPPSQPEIRAQRTVVIVRLRPVDEKSTEVTIHHMGWGDGEKWDATYNYFDKAWPNVLANLQKRFAEGPIDFKPFLERLKSQSGALGG